MSSVHPLQLLSAYYDGEATPDERLLVERHLATCPDCRARLGEYRHIGARVRELPRLSPPATMRGEVWTAIHRRQGVTPLDPALAGALRWGAVAAVLVLAVFGLWRIAMPMPPTTGLAARMIDPKPDSIGVATDTTLRLNFDKPMVATTDVTALETTLLSIEPDSPSWSAMWQGNQQLQIVPMDRWNPGTVYTVTVLENATAADGSQLGDQGRWTFITAAEVAYESPTSTLTTEPTATLAPPTATSTETAQPTETVAVEAPTNTAEPVATDTPQAPAPTATETPIVVEPTQTAAPTDTVAVPSPTTATLPTVTTKPTNTVVAPTATRPAAPTSTTGPSATRTQAPTSTEAPIATVTRAATVEPTAEDTSTPAPTRTPVSPTVEPSTTVTVEPSTTSAPDVTPSVTSEPVASSTPGPMTTPSVSPSPTVTPGLMLTPSPTVGATDTYDACGFEMRSGFGRLYKNNAEVKQTLGCPEGIEIGPAAAEEDFENGYMFWQGDSKRIYVLFRDTKEWTTFTDTYVEGDPANSGLPTPDGRYEPVRGFGKLWREQPGLRERLGWATETEHLVEAAWQDFQHGSMLWTADRAIRVLYDAGQWAQYQDVP